MKDVGAKLSMAALELCGTPWHLQGRIPGVGLDCVGILVCAAKMAGVPLKDFVDYQEEPSIELAVRQAELHLEHLPAYDVEPGDVILFKIKFRPDHSIGHFAIYVGAGKFVHTSTERPREVKVDHMTAKWEDRVTATFRIPRRFI